MNKRLVLVLSGLIVVLAIAVTVLVVQLAQPSAADQEREQTMTRLCKESTADWTFEECMDNLRSRP